MTMHRITGIALLASAWLLLGPSARADLQMSISQDASSVVDLDALRAGDQITFDVNLLGLMTGQNGQQLSFLGATLTFDSAAFGTPSITPGGIIPADTSGFLLGPDLGIADASYYVDFSNTSTPITSNGVFFQFTVTAQNAPLSGSISFSFAGAEALNGGNLTVNSGAPLGFTIQPGVAAVPEPSSLLVVLFAGSVVSLYQGRRWLRAGRPARAGGAPSGPVSAPGEAS